MFKIAYEIIEMIDCVGGIFRFVTPHLIYYFFFIPPTSIFGPTF